MSIKELIKTERHSRTYISILLVLVLLFILPAIITPPWLIYDKYYSAKGKKMIAEGRIDEKNPLLDLKRITFSSWLDSTFQAKFNANFNETFAFRKIFIRFNNQLYYTLFDKSYMNDQGIIVGKQKQLFELFYIKDYIGQGTIMDTAQAQSLTDLLYEVQSGMKRRGVGFVVLITPGKASIYPEFIPDAFKRRSSYKLRNYERMLAMFRTQGINYVDGRDITMRAKERNDMPLFCRGSSHWNYLGAYFTTDALLDKLGSIKGIKLPHVEIETIKVDYKPQGGDRDLAALLHTFVMPTDYITPHPVFKRISGRNDSGERIAFIGGSFNGLVINILDQNMIFKTMDSYYYYRTGLKTYPKDIVREKEFSVEKIDWSRDIFAMDYVVLEINEAAFDSGHVQAFLNDAAKNLQNGPRM
jgi:hypothetical protein